MKKINLTEAEKDRIRGLHKSHINQHGTLIKEGPTGARYGHGFKQDMGEQDLAAKAAEGAKALGKAVSPQEWGTFWAKAKSFGADFGSMMESCDEESIAEWKKNTSECQMANIVQNENCKTSFEQAVNLAGVLLCLGAKKASNVMDMIKSWVR